MSVDRLLRWAILLSSISILCAIVSVAIGVARWNQ